MLLFKSWDRFGLIFASENREIKHCLSFLSEFQYMLAIQVNNIYWKLNETKGVVN